MIRRALLVALAAGPALAACSFPPTTMTPEAVEAFLETPLPPGRRDLRTYTEAGIDRLVLLRLDAQGKLVWKTTHPSADETRWHVEFEYGIMENGWTAWEESKK